jgi:hypothetical protein
MSPPSSKRLRLPFVVVLSLLGLGLASACSKKEKEPVPVSAQPAAPSAAAAVKAPPAPAKCDPGPDGKCKPSPTCSPDCKPIATPDCVKCEAAGDCAQFANNCESPLLSEADKKICYDIQTCVESSHCFEGAKTTLGSCYCGKLDLKACLAAPMTGPGAPAGACHDLILKGMPNAKNQSHVLGNLTTRDRAGGLALSRFNCQKLGYKQTCASVCGWNPG